MADIPTKSGNLSVCLATTVNALTPTVFNVGQIQMLQCDVYGNLLVGIASGGGVPFGEKDTRIDETALEGSTNNIGSASQNYVWNNDLVTWVGSSYIDDGVDGSDPVGAAGNFALPGNVSRLQGYDATNDQWRRVRMLPNADPAFTPENDANFLATVNFLYGYYASDDEWRALTYWPSNDISPSGVGNAHALVVASLNTIRDNVSNAYVPVEANTEVTLLASAARAAPVDSDAQTNYNWKGAHVRINVTAFEVAGDITVTIQGYDSLSDTWYDILESNAISTTGITILKVYPGIGAVTNGAASDILPRTWRVSVDQTGTDDITYSISASMAI